MKMYMHVSILILWICRVNLASSNTSSNSSVSITNVTPNQLQRSTLRALQLTIDNMPSFTGQFLCVFAALDKVLVTNATRTNFGLTCTTPRSDLLPSIPAAEHHYTAKLSVKTTDNAEFVDTNFTFYDCSSFKSCTACVSSPFSCDWCTDGHMCTHDTAENCRNDILITGVSRERPSYRSGPMFCPTINPTLDNSSEILVPAGTKKSIRVKIRIIGQFIVQTRFLCQFNVEGRVTFVNADLIADTVYCEAIEFTYTQREANMTVTFAVVWGGSKPLDNPKNIHLVVYKCNEMANHCDTCLALDKKYGCGWCESSSRCEVSSQCDVKSGGWLNGNRTCKLSVETPDNAELVSTNSTLSINNFWPLSGAWEGGTNILIRGSNLGATFEDVGRITVAGVSCEPYKHLYIPSKEIVCKVSNAGSIDPRSGPVSVKIGNVEGESARKYSFVDPKVESVSPELGVRSGITELTIKGKYLNVGNLVEVFMDELPCKILANNETEIKCETSVRSELRKGTSNANVTVKFDGAIRTNDDFFEYRNNCTGYTSCTTCVASSTPCDWCVDGHRCSSDSAKNCRNDILVTGENHKGLSYRKGPMFCPAINSPTDGSPEILVPAGTKKSIRVKIRIIGQFIVQTRFLCQFNVEGRVTSVNADLIGDTIYCEALEFAYTESAAKIKATFGVVWGGSKPLDNPSDIHVMVYKCGEMAKSKDECLNLEGKFNCGWCQNSNSCKFKNQC